MILYYTQLGWAHSKYKGSELTRIEQSEQTGVEIKMPPENEFFYLISDIQKIGLWSGESSLNDQALFYYSQLNKIELEEYEINLIKQCSNAYVNSYRKNNDTINPAPYAPLRTQAEIDAKDERLMKLLTGRI